MIHMYDITSLSCKDLKTKQSYITFSLTQFLTPGFKWNACIVPAVKRSCADTDRIYGIQWIEWGYHMHKMWSKSIEFNYSRMAYTLDMNLFLSSLCRNASANFSFVCSFAYWVVSLVYDGVCRFREDDGDGPLPPKLYFEEPVGP